MINKFSLGGAYVPPLATYTPVTVTGGGSTSAAASAGGSTSDLTDKDLMKMMEKLEGLPSDMLELTQTLQNFYIDQQYGGRASTSNIASRYLSALAQMRTANFNNKQFEEAYKQVSENGGINEYAINEHGQLYCMNSDKDFKLLTPEELKENKGYAPLSNAELLRMRAYDPSLAFNNSIIGVVLNGIGIQTVNKYIKDIIQGMGSTSNTQEGYVSTKLGELINGLTTLSNAIAQSNKNGIPFNGTLEDLYSYKIVNKDLKSQVEQALRYIIQSLPQNARSLIKTKTKNGTDAEVLDYVTALVSSQMDTTQDYTVKLEAGPTHGKTKAEAGATDKTKLNPAALLQAGYGQKDRFTIQTAAGGSNGLQIDTVRLPITSKEGKSIGVGTLDDVASSGFAGYLDFENATMGGVNISPTGFADVAVNGTALYVGELPIDIEEYNKTGNIRPDIAMLGRYKEAQNKIKKENITDPKEINNVYQEMQLPIMYGPNGDILGNYKKFGIMNGSAIQQAFSEEAEFADYLQETTDENEVRNVVSKIQKGRGESDRIDFNEKGWWNSIWNSYDHVYKGTIFIPVNEDYFAGAVGFGETPTPAEAESIEARQLALQRENAAAQSYVNPGML